MPAAASSAADASTTRIGAAFASATSCGRPRRTEVARFSASVAEHATRIRVTPAAWNHIALVNAALGHGPDRFLSLWVDPSAECPRCTAS